MNQHIVRGALIGVWVLAGAAVAWVPRGARSAAAAGTPEARAPARDTVVDSLLVSDSIYQGWKWWHVYCYRCHGEDARNPILPSAPDLRMSLSPTGKAFPRDSFVHTALTGRLEKGMPAWNVMLDTTAIQELYLYVKARSDGWLKPGRPHRLSDLQNKSQ